MDVRVIFAFSALMSFVSCAVIAKLYVWPWLRARDRDQALVSLVAPHMFLRFLGLSFLVPGVVSPALPAAFAVPAAYGDFVAWILAIVATIALAKHASWVIPAVWVFNVWGAADLLFAFYLTRGRPPRFNRGLWELRSTSLQQLCRSYTGLGYEVGN